MHHRVDELLLEIPSNWGFTSVLVAPGAPPGFVTNLVLTRGTLEKDESLGGYADRQVALMAKETKKFLLRGRSEIAVGGEPASVIRCAWHGTQGPVEQEITIVVRNGQPLLFTATVPKNQADRFLPLYRAVIGTLRIDDTFARSGA